MKKKFDTINVAIDCQKEKPQIFGKLSDLNAHLFAKDNVRKERGVKLWVCL